MNKKDTGIIRRYEASHITDLYEAYGRTSQAKRNAWESCKVLCNNLNGEGLKIIGANCHQFSAGFIFEEDSVKYIMYITAETKRKIRFEEVQ